MSLARHYEDLVFEYTSTEGSGTDLLLDGAPEGYRSFALWADLIDGFFGPQVLNEIEYTLYEPSTGHREWGVAELIPADGVYILRRNHGQPYLVHNTKTGPGVLDLQPGIKHVWATLGAVTATAIGQFRNDYYTTFTTTGEPFPPMFVLGRESGHKNVTASTYGTFIIGVASGQFLESSSDGNMLIGNYIAPNLTTGQRNLIIGSYARTPTSADNDALIIDHNSPDIGPNIGERRLIHGSFDPNNQHFSPGRTDAVDLGISDRRWKTGYFQSIIVNDTNILGLFSNVIEDDVYETGGGDLITTENGLITAFTPGQGGGGGTELHLVEEADGRFQPKSDAVTDLGGAASRWRNGWFSGLIESGGLVMLAPTYSGFTTTAQPQGQGLNISKHPNDPEHDIIVSQGYIFYGGKPRAIFSLSSSSNFGITKRIDATWAPGDNAGGMSPNTVLSPNTEYVVYMVTNTTTGADDIMFDNTGGSAPAGYELPTPIGRFTTDGNSNIADVRSNSAMLGRLQFPTEYGNSGQVLTADGAGNVKWQDATGGGGNTIAGCMVATSNQAFSTGVWGVVQFQSVTVEEGITADITNNRFVIQESGVYMLSAKLSMGTTARFDYVFARNGTTIPHSQVRQQGVGVSHSRTNQFMATLSAGDYVQIMLAVQGNESTLGADHINPTFMIYKL